jgi:hypothetical protein
LLGRSLNGYLGVQRSAIIKVVILAIIAIAVGVAFSSWFFVRRKRTEMAEFAGGTATAQYRPAGAEPYVDRY